MSTRALLDLLLPATCAGCGIPGAAACAGCLGAVRPLPAPWCDGCGAPVPVPVTRCGECRGPVDGARQAVVYEGVGAALVLALKDRRRRDLAPVLAALVARTVPPPPLGAVLVPVPAGPERVRRRGFDQAVLLADALARIWGRPVCHALQRVRDAPAQRGAGRAERVRQMRAAIVLGSPPPPRVATLVDDVRTTGATLAACAGALRRGGTTHVAAVCVARALNDLR